jgi:hypothetical protein
MAVAFQVGSCSQRARARYRKQKAEPAPGEGQSALPLASALCNARAPERVPCVWSVRARTKLILASCAPRPAARRLACCQAIEVLHCELNGLLVIVSKETAPALANALSPTLPSAALAAVRDLLDRAGQTPAEELKERVDEVKAIALSKDARLGAGGAAAAAE